MLAAHPELQVGLELPPTPVLLPAPT
jgi:hypothetical protein